ncbi:alanine racemase [Rugosimonospora africana]|uniref:Amino acid deaminase n=1 Tax=Rugosimonospora africana TaxID=556532 RepID=A0A8J3R4X9_9ACTN|nr:alanine racemase [Rugosimonospora africana]GIH21395.1 amino acid deaminase [Rugosimonospora africana]
MSDREAEKTDWRDKGFWFPDGPGDPVGQRLVDGPFTWPVLVARESALRHNITTMAGYLADRGVRHAPHGKTTMAPSVFAAQLAAGAWGLSAATANQLLVYRRAGVNRVLLANQLLDPRPLQWLASSLDDDPEFELLSYVDSEAGVAALAATTGTRPFRVLVEIGHPGGRTGCRTVPEAVAVARAAAASPRIEVAGVAGYEGKLSTVDEARSFMGTLRAAAEELPVTGPVVASAGGSVYFDVVAEELSGHGYEVILRPGAYVTHDHGFYARRSPLASTLRPALEVWAQVLSVPEPGLAIVGMGRRDVPYDEGLPVPLGHAGGASVTGTVDALNDQHAYLRADGLHPGDLLRFGISHPCSAFDRWRVIPVIDDADRVTDLIHTYF